MKIKEALYQFDEEFINRMKSNSSRHLDLNRLLFKHFVAIGTELVQLDDKTNSMANDNNKIK